MEVLDGGESYSSTSPTLAMSVLQDLNSCLIQEEHVDERTLVVTIVHPLHLVWVALSTVECVAGHRLIGGDKMLLFMDTIEEGKALMGAMWTVCL